MRFAWSPTCLGSFPFWGCRSWDLLKWTRELLKRHFGGCRRCSGGNRSTFGSLGLPALWTSPALCLLNVLGSFWATLTNFMNCGAALPCTLWGLCALWGPGRALVALGAGQHRGVPTLTPNPHDPSQGAKHKFWELLLRQRPRSWPGG